MLFRSTNSRLSLLRSQVKLELENLAAEIQSAFIQPSSSPVLLPPTPDFGTDVALYLVLQLCTGLSDVPPPPPSDPAISADGTYSLNVLRHHPAAGQTDSTGTAALGQNQRSQAPQTGPQSLPAEDIQDFQIKLDAPSAFSTSRWVATLTAAWRQSIGNGSSSDLSSFGRRLVELVCKHNQRLYSARRKLLCDDRHFKRRDRDPSASS